MIGQFTKPLPFAALLAVVLVCAGCAATDPAPTSPSPSDSTQSIGAACETVRASVADATAQLQNLDAADPQASVAAMTGVADELGRALSAVDNADVAAVLPGLQSGFAQAAGVLQSIAGGDLSKLPALQQATADIQSSLSAFADLCDAS